ncbi:uncharacterized protein SCHCODRAFT_02633734 [Schizophyllum commune H4-8]|nr:uncharacterized protein SCHCODRAFT_02633734 [Schizophyllum commune H4-8]KAI5889172.1 hypothetical protein SCHCODRAFT_02633734 [Schizophyllum commune H4-8]
MAARSLSTVFWRDNADPTYEALPLDSGDVPRQSPPSRVSRTPLRLAVLVAGVVLLVVAVVTVDQHIAALRNRAAMLSSFWPVTQPNRTDVYEDENSRTMHRLIECVADGTCTERQTHVVILASWHFRGSVEGQVSGEDIWARSVLLALKEMGYSAIITAGTNEDLIHTYHLFPDLVKVIIAEGWDIDMCNKDPSCVQSESNPLGIPLWKLFAFHFWGGHAHPLGGPWTLSPENYPLLMGGDSVNNTYLGYSIERACEKLPVVAHTERPKQAYILAKRLSYFYDHNFAWRDVAFDDAGSPARFVAGMIEDADAAGKSVPAGVANHGRLNKTAFYLELARSRVLVGIGSPLLSPSPYDALCMGVPFINPIQRWDRAHPENREAWLTQHDGLKYENPPHVYNVHANDVAGFWAAVKQAMETGIEGDRYIVSNMTMDALKTRLTRIIETDWEGRAKSLSS